MELAAYHAMQKRNPRPSQGMQITASCSHLPISLCRGVARTVKHILRTEMPGCRWEISVAAVAAHEMRTLNRRYRGRSYIADVLSFLLIAPTPSLKGIGEIIICLSQVRHDARILKVPWRTHFYRMLVHACLHLAGYDHRTTREQHRMEDKEQVYMTQ